MGTAGTGSGSNFKGIPMRTSFVAFALALTATVASAPANALSGPVQGAKLQNASSDVEQVYVARRTYVGRGRRGRGVRCSSRTRLLLVLHRHEQDPGLLGRLSLKSMQTRRTRRGRLRA